jgi:hypothetical protein
MFLNDKTSFSAISIDGDFIVQDIDYASMMEPYIPVVVQ